MAPQVPALQTWEHNVISVSFVGIFFIGGLFFNLEAREWTSYQAPFTPETFNTNSLFSFLGKPTIFGTEESCQGNTQEHTGILAYGEQFDTWKSIGYMKTSRTFQEVVSVPASFCDFFE